MRDFGALSAATQKQTSDVKRLDGPRHANDLRVPELNPFFCESRFGPLEVGSTQRAPVNLENQEYG